METDPEDAAGHPSPGGAQGSVGPPARRWGSRPARCQRICRLIPILIRARAAPDRQTKALRSRPKPLVLGIEPSTLASVIGYETIGSFDPGIVGGKKNRASRLDPDGAD